MKPNLNVEELNVGRIPGRKKVALSICAGTLHL